ncbi:hypothetical protein BKA64DRAFT_163850 [Cadophora sp. MPI-SDFR-AT-0126]|nr:hypothetical protein BKA64DRAFT_163850 [Leotiomycetes sp. MPI-SDFR-AT-0126]
MALQSAANFLGNQALRGLRMGTVRYGPAIAQARAVAAEAFIRAADASRQFKRDEAIKLEDPLTEEEYGVLEADLVHDKFLSDEEHEDSGETIVPCRETIVEGHPRAIRVCCQTIRSSREAFKTTGIESPIPVFSHWCLELVASSTNYERTKQFKRTNRCLPESAMEGASFTRKWELNRGGSSWKLLQIESCILARNISM